jgi:hypothetical protein
VRLVSHTDPDAQRFDLWAVPGRKTLTPDGRHFRLQGTCGRQLIELVVSDGLPDGAPFCYAMSAGAEPKQYRFTLESAVTLLQRPRAATRTALSRPPRSAIIHARALQSLDGTLAGASQREIATALFGEARTADGWSPDGELRAQVRYLIQRGRALMEGEYRSLLA